MCCRLVGLLLTQVRAWRSNEEILENVIILSGGQCLLADQALQHSVSNAGLHFHSDSLVVRSATRTGKISGMISVHLRRMPRIPGNHQEAGRSKIEVGTKV
jgi:hypothetical protein